MKYETEVNGAYGIGAKYLKSRQKKIMGNAFKGRGLFQKVTNARLMKDLTIEGKMNDFLTAGQKVRMVDFVRTDEAMLADGKPEVVKRMYVLPDQALPEIEGAEVRERGTFEIRQTQLNGVVLWRDYTKAEREKMGEITDSHDDWTYQGEGEPESVVDGSELMMASYRPLSGVEYVRVPDTIIAKTGGRKKYGDLAGKYVRSEIYRDLMAVQAMQSHSWFNKLMTQWKLNKTARNPVTHMNNVMSNVLLADIADVRADHMLDALRSWRNQDESYTEANALGAFGGSFLEGEIKREILDPIILQLQKEVDGTPGDAKVGGLFKMIKTMNVFSDGLIKGVGKVDNAMTNAYQLEDEIFRMAAYIKFKEEGQAPADAALNARDQFLNYDIRAPGVNALRRSFLPFIAYTYRAGPVLAQSVAQRPWKLAKYFTLTYMLNAIAYAVTDGDEDEERRSLRDNEQGLTWVGAPRMMRMPWDDDNNNPVFMDIRRWIPAGDIFDVSQSQSTIPVLAPLLPGGPLGLPFEMLLNKQGFTGQEIVNHKVDDTSTKFKKSAAFLWKSWMPSNPLVPFSWYQEKIYNAAIGATDRQGRRYSMTQALLSSVGLKIKPQDVSYNMTLKAEEFARVERAISTEINYLQRNYQRGLVRQSTYDKEMKRFMGQMETLKENMIKTFRPAE